MNTEPLVSCITPTYNRRRFLPAAIGQFQRQDWPSAELIVVDDGEDCVRDLVPDDPRITYVRLDSRATIGRKRNIACERARGEVVAHWDDDDWHAPDRLRRQVPPLLASSADLCGITKLLFCNPDEGRAWEFVYLGGTPWVGGSSMVYRREAWARTPFPDCDVGEDARFAASRPRHKILVMTDSTFHVGRVHATNVNPKQTSGPAWRPLALESIRKVVGADWPTFVQPVTPSLRPTHASGPLVSCIMPTANRPAFVALALEHFRAQDYAPVELVVVDAGSESVSGVCAGDTRVRYVRARPGLSIGAQRNLACSEARGEFVIHWDDDDWFGPDRIRRQIEPIASGRADVTGLETRYVWNLADGAFWTISDELHKRMFVGDVHGGTLAYRKSLLARGMRYDDINLAEDAGLLRRMLGSGARLERVRNEGVFVYVRHGTNAWRFDTGTFLGAEGWSRVDAPPALPPRTIDCYHSIGRGSASGATATRSTEPPRQDRSFVDCLGSTAIAAPDVPLRCDRCLAMVASESCADLLDGVLATIDRFGDVADVARVVFVPKDAARCEAIARRHGAEVLRCGSARGPGPWLKGALYSITRVVEAKQYLCLDVDLLVLESLAPLFAMHASLPKGKVLVAPEVTLQPVPDVRHALETVYLSSSAETDRLLSLFPAAGAQSHVINDGLFVADFDALAAVDEALRAAPVVWSWVSARRDVWWRTKGALNVALAQARAIEPLDRAYNAQLHVAEAALHATGARPKATWLGQPARVLHYNGRGRASYGAHKRAILRSS